MNWVGGSRQRLKFRRTNRAFPRKRYVSLYAAIVVLHLFPFPVRTSFIHRIYSFIHLGKRLLQRLMSMSSQRLARVRLAHIGPSLLLQSYRHLHILRKHLQRATPHRARPSPQLLPPNRVPDLYRLYQQSRVMERVCFLLRLCRVEMRTSHLRAILLRAIPECCRSNQELQLV